MLAFGAENIRWLGLLLGMILFSVLGAVFPNFFTQAVKPRGHNVAKLLNECLGKLQLAYLLYFSSMYVGGNFDAKYTWIKSLVWCGILASLIFYGYGLFSTTVQDKRIDSYYHQNLQCLNDDMCKVKISLFGLRLWGFSFIFVIVSTVGGVLLALMIKP